MFDNIDRKLKNLATVLFILGAIGSIISGIIIMRGSLIIEGLLTIIIGTVASLVSSWVIYGIGENISLSYSILTKVRIDTPSKENEFTFKRTTNNPAANSKESEVWGTNNRLF